MALNAKLTSAVANIGLYLSGVSERPLPGILLLHEIFGVNHAMEIAADGFARAGFVVAAPDLYHAFAPGTALSYQAVDRPRAVKLKSKLREMDAVNDIAIVQHWLKKQPFCNGKVALLGFCLGGKLAALTAAADAPDCTVAFYPVHLENFLVEISRITCPIQIHLGKDDKHVAPVAREIIRRTICKRPRNEFIIYPGAGHGFYNSVRADAFHPRAAAEAHQAALYFLKRWLAQDKTAPGFASAAREAVPVVTYSVGEGSDR